MTHLLASIAIGLALSAPLGPIGMLCLHHALSRGFKMALIAGAGAAVADTLFVGIAAFGLSEVGDWLLDRTFLFEFIGGLLLCYLGWKITFSPLVALSAKPEALGPFRAFASTFLLTLSNPFTIVASATLIGCLTSIEGSWDSTSTTIGAFIGCMIWWTSLSGAASYFKDKIGPRAIQLIKQTLGIAVIGFGLFLIGYSFRFTS